MDSLTLVAKNKAGDSVEFHLYKQEKQYSIGRQGDISLQSLVSEFESSKKTIYPIAAYITFIDGAWYFRSAKGHRRGIKMVKVNGKPIDSSRAEVRIKHGYTISFGEKDDIVVQVYESVQEETLKNRVPELAGLFDKVKMEFESLNDEIRRTFSLTDRANTGVIMSRLENCGLFNAAYEYNLARGLRNIVAHPSPGVVTGIKRQYIYDALQSIESVRKSLQNLKKTDKV